MVIALPLMIFTVRTFPLSPLLNRVIALHMVFLLVGAHYTYALTPVGLWMQEAFDLARNPYDRFGHIMQGIPPPCSRANCSCACGGKGEWLVVLPGRPCGARLQRLL